MANDYFHRGISRLRAEELLQQAKDDGSFIVRDSETLSGAYVLCLLHQSRVHQYRILPGSNGKLCVQTEGAKQETCYADLSSLIRDYRAKGKKNGLISPLVYPIAPEREEDQDTDDEDQEETRPVLPLSPSCTSISMSESLDIFQDRLYTELLQNYSKLDLTSCDENLINVIKLYIENGYKKDISTTDGSSFPEFQKMMEVAAFNLNKELDLYRKKLMIFNNLFELAAIKRRGSLSLRQNSVTEQVTSDIPSMMDKMNQCREDILTIENKVQEGLQYPVQTQYDYPYVDVPNDVQAPVNTTPFLSSLNTKIVPQTTFEVKMFKHGKIPVKNLLRVDIPNGQLIVQKPASKDNLDNTVYTQDKICQLVKSTKDNTRLDMTLENKKKQTFCFENVHRRENFCQQIMHMKNKHSKPDHVDQLSIFVGTWNMGDKTPTQNISSWLHCNGRGKATPYGHIPYDMYVIGTQESAMTEKEWVNFLKKQITQSNNLEVEMVEVMTLWGIRLVILVQKKHWHSINRIQRSSVRTGIANTLGNKGAVGISFYFRGTSFCFINSHLTSGDERNERRNQNYRDIIKGLSLGQKHLDLFDVTNQFHHIFWIGDLNYRVEDEIQTIIQKCEEEDITYLLTKDQLLKTQNNKRAFCGFEEARIEFMPTYRLPRTKICYEYDWLKHKKSGDRINAPSFCDRILWRSYPETHIENITYGCAEKILGSDHRPVFASFNVGVSSDFVMNRDSLMEGSPVEIIFEEIEAEVKTCCKQSYFIEFRSTCLQEFVSSQSNATFNDCKSGVNTCPVWSSQHLPKLKPLFGDQEYLEEQHIMVAVRSKDGDKESYGECVVALKRKFEQSPQKFECLLLHQGEVTGKLAGKMHVLIGGTAWKKTSIKTYELVAFDTDTYCDPDLLQPDITPTTPDVIRTANKAPTACKQTSPTAQTKQKGTSRQVSEPITKCSRPKEYEEISGQWSRPTSSGAQAQYEEIDPLQISDTNGFSSQSQQSQSMGARRKQLPPPSVDCGTPPISSSSPPAGPPPPLPKKQASYVNVIQDAL